MCANRHPSTAHVERRGGGDAGNVAGQDNGLAVFHVVDVRGSKNLTFCGEGSGGNVAVGAVMAVAKENLRLETGAVGRRDDVFVAVHVDGVV